MLNDVDRGFRRLPRARDNVAWVRQEVRSPTREVLLKEDERAHKPLGAQIALILGAGRIALLQELRDTAGEASEIENVAAGGTLHQSDMPPTNTTCTQLKHALDRARNISTHLEKILQRLQLLVAAVFQTRPVRARTDDPPQPIR